VAALLGLLAFLAYGTASASPGAPLSASAYGGGVVVRGDQQLAAPVATVDAVGRNGQQPAARTHGSDRTPVTHPLGWVLGVALLLLAAAALAGGVRRLCRRPTYAAWRGGLAPRAPPVLAR
jgi:hypothetical protein